MIAYRVCCETTFEAAHYLPGYDGPCKNMHGHTWRARLHFEGQKLNEQGMLIDFRVVKSTIRTAFDHRILNDVLPVTPTAEHVAQYILEHFCSMFLDRVPFSCQCYKVELWETPNNKVTVEVDDYV